jgi:hypothetical protein
MRKAPILSCYIKVRLPDRRLLALVDRRRKRVMDTLVRLGMQGYLCKERQLMGRPELDDRPPGSSDRLVGLSTDTMVLGDKSAVASDRVYVPSGTVELDDTPLGLSDRVDLLCDTVVWGDRPLALKDKAVKDTVASGGTAGDA